MSLLRVASVASLSTLLGCATTSGVPIPPAPVPPGAPALDFQPAGEVLWADIGEATTPRRASFDGWRVTGPPVSLIRRPDGLWEGTFQGRGVLVTVRPGALSAPGLDIAVTRQSDGSLLVAGNSFGSKVEFAVGKDHIRGTAGANTFDLLFQAPGVYGSQWVGMLTLTGEAARIDDPTMPQFFLALLSVLLR